MDKLPKIETRDFIDDLSFALINYLKPYNFVFTLFDTEDSPISLEETFDRAGFLPIFLYRQKKQISEFVQKMNQEKKTEYHTEIVLLIHNNSSLGKEIYLTHNIDSTSADYGKLLSYTLELLLSSKDIAFNKKYIDMTELYIKFGERILDESLQSFQQQPEQKISTHTPPREDDLSQVMNQLKSLVPDIENLSQDKLIIVNLTDQDIEKYSTPAKEVSFADKYRDMLNDALESSVPQDTNNILSTNMLEPEYISNILTEDMKDEILTLIKSGELESPNEFYAKIINQFKGKNDDE